MKHYRYHYEILSLRLASPELAKRKLCNAVGMTGKEEACRQEEGNDHQAQIDST
jgi:hypothetical protein